MRGTTILFGLLILSGLAGFVGPPAVRADDPEPCTKYECRTVHSYWSAWERGGDTVAFFEVGNTTPSNDGYGALFTTNSTEKSPTTKSGQRDLWCYNKCEPMCGKSLNENNKMAWQSPQEVVRLGTGGQPEDTTFSRHICTATEDGKGKKAADQKNDNKNEKLPPGVKYDEGGGGPPGPPP